MDKEDKNNKDSKSAKGSCCYYVVDGCGCVVGSYCCDGPDMTQCRFETC